MVKLPPNSHFYVLVCYFVILVQLNKWQATMTMEVHNTGGTRGREKDLLKTGLAEESWLVPYALLGVHRTDDVDKTLYVFCGNFFCHFV